MRLLHLALVAPFFAAPFACAATSTNTFTGGSGGTGTGAGAGTGGLGGGEECNFCFGNTYTPCDNGKAGTPVKCDTGVCAPGIGCAECAPGGGVCSGNEVHQCSSDGKVTGTVIQVCDPNKGEICSGGKCGTLCDLAADQPSNVGCEFWAVDLDQQDSFNDPASAPWGIVLSNASDTPADVTIEINEAPVGQPLSVNAIAEVNIPANDLKQVILPTRELDCGTKPNDFASPGTCLSSRAFRITSTAPIIVYQFNVFANAYSNDASLLLPTSALGKLYRVIGWGAGHPVQVPIVGLGIDRSYVTIVGTKPGTTVKVSPSWRIKGNPPIAATMPGEDITVTIGPFDVLNLETDDATFQDDPKTVADLSGTVVQASAPVAVFSGVESTGAPGSAVDVPTPPGWMSGDSCCLDHLEDQMFPIESVGTHYVIARSPVRSTSSFREADVIRFVGVAEAATVTTNLPPPYDTFSIAPGEIKTTYAQNNFVAGATKPVMIGQILVSNEYVDGPALGDPSLTVMPPVEQFRSDYVILSPGGWNQSWVVIVEPAGAATKLDGNPTTGCIVEPAGAVEGTSYQSKRCQVQAGVHKLSGDMPFGIVAYGYGSAGSYALAGGAAVKHVYDPPPLK